MSTTAAKLSQVRKVFQNILNGADKISNDYATIIKREIIEAVVPILLPNAAAQMTKQLESLHTVVDVMSYVSNSGYCTYMFVHLLTIVINCFDSKELREKFKLYEINFNEFCKTTTIEDLYQAYLENRALQPISTLGIPSFKFYLLDKEMAKKSLFEITDMLSGLFPLIRQLPLQRIEKDQKGFYLVYSAHKHAIDSMWNLIKNPKIIKQYEEAFVDVKFGMDYDPLIAKV